MVRSPALESGPVQLLLRRRMRDGDQQACTLLQGLAVEVHGSELGHEPVVVTTPAPSNSVGQIFDTPLLVIEGMAMIALPPFESDAP